ncbi:unnamed protein product [Phytomonas sp. EM1]|nr:unnamed protein product [Phytomonas sp. EM1]|eukprot:CCW60858.1 unnamed protein product [Phytomonas sp. isolate EM1]
MFSFANENQVKPFGTQNNEVTPKKIPDICYDEFNCHYLIMQDSIRPVYSKVSLIL